MLQGALSAKTDTMPIDQWAPSLSICMATRNRGPFLRETLESILGQDVQDVELVVVDGGSSDETPIVLEQLSRQFPRLRVIRLGQPAGVDRDFALAVAEAHGQYCWLFPDDDLLRPGALRRVLQAIGGSYSLVIVNAEVRSTDLATQLDPVRLRLEKDRIYRPEDQAQLLAETARYLSYIGGVVVRKDIWEERDKASYFGSSFIHVGVIFQAPLPSSVIALAEPLITIRYGNAQWRSRGFEIWMFKWPELIWSFSHLPEAARKAVVPREPWRQAKTLMYLRATGVYDKHQYRKWIRERPCPWWTRQVGRLVAGLPGPPLNAMVRLYYSRFRPDSELELVDLDLSPFARDRGSGMTSIPMKGRP